MYYLIYSEDVENSLSLRLSVREQHIERLQQLQSNEGGGGVINLNDVTK